MTICDVCKNIGIKAESKRLNVKINSDKEYEGTIDLCYVCRDELNKNYDRIHDIIALGLKVILEQELKNL